MTQIPAESSVWRRIEGVPPGMALDDDDDMLPVFPEAHRGDWLDDPRYAKHARVERFVSPAGDERAAYGDKRDSDTFFERS
jgi:hypothetical protein